MQKTGGIQDIHYQGGTQRMTIPVGQYYTGSNMRLVFVNDNDAAPTSTSTFSHVHVCKAICVERKTIIVVFPTLLVVE